MSTEPENLILRMLRDMRAEIGDIRSVMATKSDVADLRSEMTSGFADLRSEIGSLRADVAADIATIRKEVGEQVAGLRRAVVEYHSSVIGSDQRARGPHAAHRATSGPACFRPALISA